MTTIRWKDHLKSKLILLSLVVCLQSASIDQALTSTQQVVMAPSASIPLEEGSLTQMNQQLTRTRMQQRQRLNSQLSNLYQSTNFKAFVSSWQLISTKPTNKEKISSNVRSWVIQSKLETSSKSSYKRMKVSQKSKSLIAMSSLSTAKSVITLKNKVKMYAKKSVTKLQRLL